MKQVIFEKNEKRELLKELLRTREDYSQTIKNLNLNEKEKEIFLLAFVHIKKKNIDQKLIDQAYDIVMKKSMDMDGAYQIKDNKVILVKKSMDKDGSDQSKDNKVVVDELDKQTNDFMHYDIFLSQQGDYKAVQEGWSWSAFFTTFIWALLNRMWYLGTILWVPGWFLFMVIVEIYLEGSSSIVAIIVIVLGFFVALLFGSAGNEWKGKNLLARGYKKISRVTAATPEEAIANFIEFSGKEGATINGNYNIFSNPLGNYEAVKKGWSWTAFFFVFVWALFNKMWALGSVGWISWMIWNYFLVTVLFEGAPLLFLFFQIISGLYVALLFGSAGNEWKEKNFLARGYKKISSVTASTAEGAIAIYIKLAEKDKVMEQVPQATQAPSEEFVENSTKPVDKQNLVEELRNLAELKNDGLLTEEEFSAGKNKLLNG